MNALKILYVIEKISPEKAGAGINLHNFLKFGRKEFQSRVLALGSESEYEEGDESNGYYRFRGLNKGLIKRVMLQVLALPKIIKHVIWSDIVHIKSIPKGIFLISVVTKMMGRKLIQEPTLVGHDDPNTFNTYQSKKLLHFCWEISDSAVFISSDVKRHSLHYKGEVITRGVDLNTYTEVRDENLRMKHGIGEEVLVVSQVGNISDRKNQLKTLEIVKQLKIITDYDFIVFLIGPDGNQAYKERLMGFALENNIDCRFTGYTTQVEKYLQCSDLYFFPSKDEGFGVSIIQALASGLNTYTSPVGCYEELKELGFDNVIDGNVNVWSNHIKASLEDQGINRKNNNLLVKSFSEENIARLLFLYYEGVLRK